VTITTDPDELMAALEEADETWGHNTYGFDGLAMAWYHGLDWKAWCAKSWDTDPLARYDFPPRSREHGSADQYDLDHVAQRYGLAGKLTGDEGLAALKRKYKGYDRIPVDDPAYRAYLTQDVVASRDVAKVLRRALNDYTRREHQLLYYTGQMTLNGFHVNRPLLEARIKDGEDRKRTALQKLNNTYGIPLGKTVLKGRAPNKREVWEPYKSPLATKEGKAALVDAFAKLGAKHYPKTGKTKEIMAGREGMEKMAAHYVVKKGLTQVKELCDLVTTVTTVRTIYQTALNNLAPDGKIHPRVSMRQASGRLSVTPGMTVFGKHDGRWVEREIFDAEEGLDEPYVLITCDLSQVDMRAVAGHSQDPAYMELFGREDDGTPKDAHQMIADMLGIKRQDAKARGHGWNYGLGANRMIREGADPKVVWAFVNGMERRFRRLCEWREEVRDIGSSGELLDNGFGRPMRCDPRFAFTQAPALMGQGTARDITMEVLIRLLEAHPEYVYYLRNQVHDEWVFSVPESRAEEIKGHIVDAFTWEWRNVPILCDAAGPGASWGELSKK
jgi:DNA polymerase-1